MGFREVSHRNPYCHGQVEHPGKVGILMTQEKALECRKFNPDIVRWDNRQNNCSIICCTLKEYPKVCRDKQEIREHRYGPGGP